MTMKISAVLPFDRLDCGTEFVSPEAVKEISTLLERLGFDGCSVTDHPCPTGRWLDAGGHFAQDPFVMLSLVAAHTTRLRLQTGILVLPYRNPFITARAVATLDVFSKGRVSLGVGAGYLKGEYRALGIDFEQRNEIMDEYLKALKAAWCHDEFTFEGTGYKAQGNRILPRPLQQPHPPLWIGGNSKRAIRRAVELGDAWNPFFTTGALTTTSRTLDMTGEADLAEGIAYLKAQSEQTGRAKPPAIILGNLFAPGEPSTAAALVDRLGACAALGVTGAATHIEGNSRAAWCDNAERFAKEVMAKLP
jgi:probable F420-dependent oxidoreductase